jgi:hypothetical protein
MAQRRHKPRKPAPTGKAAPARRPRKRPSAGAATSETGAPPLGPPRDVPRPMARPPRLGAVERGVLRLANFAATGVRRVYRLLHRD